MTKHILFSSLLLTIFSCKNQANREHDRNTNDHTKTEMTDSKNTIVVEGKNTSAKHSDLNITFKGIIEDSRCPANTTCVWEGFAVVELEVMTPSSRPRIVHLATANTEQHEAQKTVEIYGHKITLVSLTPQRDDTKKAENSLELQIDKL